MVKSGETIDYERALEKVLASRDWDSRQQAIDFLDKHLRDAELSPPQEGVIWIWEYNGPVLDENGKYVGGPTRPLNRQQFERLLSTLRQTGWGGAPVKYDWEGFVLEAAAQIYENSSIKDELELRKVTLNALAERGIMIHDEKGARHRARRVWKRMHDD